MLAEPEGRDAVAAFHSKEVIITGRLTSRRMTANCSEQFIQ